MTPAERDMPVVACYWSELRRAWVIALPFGPDLEARTEADVISLVARYAPGSAVRFLRTPGPETPLGRSGGEGRARLSPLTTGEAGSAREGPSPSAADARTGRQRTGTPAPGPTPAT